MSARPSRDDQLEANRKAMRLVIDLNLDLLPNDPPRRCVASSGSGRPGCRRWT